MRWIEQGDAVTGRMCRGLGMAWGDQDRQGRLIGLTSPGLDAARKGQTGRQD